jgi:hypothetical protein
MKAIRPLTKSKTMDSSEKISKVTSDAGSECSEEGEPGDHFTNGCNFLQPTWLRCTFRPCDEVDRFLLDYGRYFLLPVGFVFWVILLMA